MPVTRRAFQTMLPFAPVVIVKASKPKRNALFLALDGLND